MSIRDEIRAGLVDGPKSCSELLPLVPSVEGDYAKLSSNLSVLATARNVRRTGLSEDNRPIYAIDDWPAEGRRSTATASASEGPAKGKPAAKAGAERGTTKPARTPAKKKRATRPPKPAHKPAATKRSGARRTKRAAATPKSPTRRPNGHAAVVSNTGANQRQVAGDHYRRLDPQPWDVITAWGLGFLAGNVVKYVARAPAKGGVEDLQTARHYLDKLIEQAEAA